jgi:probable O-glycosylation ligase (exosortase A-associated)
MLRSLLVFSILIPGVFLAFTSRYRALLLYLWFAFFRPQDWMWFDITTWRPSLFLGLLLVVPAVLTGVLPTIGHFLCVGSVLFVLAALVAQASAVNQAVGWYWIDEMGRLVLICLFAVTVIKTPRDWMRAVAVIAASLGFYGIKAGLASLLAGGAMYAQGLGGAFSDNNGYALAVVMVMPLIALVGQNAQVAFAGLLPSWTSRWIRIGCFVSLPLCAYTVVSTFSRAGFLALVAALAAWVAFHPRRFRIFIAVAVISYAATFVPLPKGYLARLGTIAPAVQGGQVDARPDQDVSEGRLYFWTIAVRMARDHPFGVGMRNFQSAFPGYDVTGGAYGENRDVHSSHFQVLAELGYPGLLIWLALFSYGFWVAFRVKRRGHAAALTPSVAHLFTTAPVALIASMTGFLVGGSFISSALNDLTWVTFALLAALDRISARAVLGQEKGVVRAYNPPVTQGRYSTRGAVNC